MLNRLRYSPLLSQLVIVRRCNLSCGYCNEYDKTSDPIPLDVLKDRTAQLKALGTFAICFTGGEPTLHPELTQLIAYARHDLQFLKTTMITNGTYLTRQLVESLNDAGLQIMQISIDGVQRNDVTVKVLDTLRKRLETLRDHAKFEVVVSGVVGSCPPSETFEVIAFAKQMGFRPRVLLVHNERGEITLSEEERQAYYALQQQLGRHPFELSAYRHRLITDGVAPFKCRAGSRYLYVDEDGLVSWCSQTRAHFSKPLAEYGAHDLREQFYAHKKCQDKCTLGCVRSSSALDGWRRQNAH